MDTSTETLTIPLRTDQDGVIRVGQTRVRLNTVVYAFNEGATPEEIVSQYSALSLQDVYAVLAYYMKHQAEVDTLIAKQTTSAAQTRQHIEMQPGNQALRARLQARKAHSAQ